MTEEELIEALGERWPHWRDAYDCPFEAAEALGLRLDYDADYDPEELDFE